MSRVCGDLAADSLRQDFSGRWIGFGRGSRSPHPGHGQSLGGASAGGHVRISRTGQGAVRIEAVADREGTLEITVFSVTGQVLWRTDLSVQASRPRPPNGAAMTGPAARSLRYILLAGRGRRP